MMCYRDNKRGARFIKRTKEDVINTIRVGGGHLMKVLQRTMGSVWSLKMKRNTSNEIMEEQHFRKMKDNMQKHVRGKKV